MGKLQVCICAARSLHDRRTLCTPDPYCCVQVGDTIHKTKVVNNTCNPVWNQTFRFHVANEANAQVCVELWNRDIVADEILGSLCLPLTDLTMGIAQDSWYLLSHSATNAELRIRVLACDFGKKPQLSERWKVTNDINNCPVLAAGGKPPASADPVTVPTNSNNTPFASKMGPAVVPEAVASA
ncbi:C2 domain containing protein, putative [Trypanosoma equiperdum]|uniref:C2 domain-containing protein n=4 Tax=Trypanozoon TaxID=39700 RepID=Q57WL5_TRYB2|nr:hypothetical protein, conserved [Trypanosoma brucei gambiense DAL972]XP_847638.1 hypothetical protein, conserved [Trypanosoma brucei brucei TREU927]AAX70004.1 hypothetical protein, conserved [Trypanosoma brucei]RHW71002.1 C2 domain containing protein [Trypanosoma brucei equiperdum]SCU72818.1 C2 domain containing protein, putative [Trypanosoma equiperdum]AAZ13572.1 hypothetical protein, conserved [Trypanosoma brucei brucei TREU927]CBH13903.1 hypothetical protein, conserved [Trypanosoma bruc|eukprot:XP_011776179.1 hypothetical protein, conserved [Trypanosoma brucei gambiense DAL972]